MLKWCVPNKEQRAFCRMGLHSSGCRSMCIPRNAFDKYQNKNLHKDCQAPRHYLWLRKFLRCKLGENWKDTVRKHYPCFDYTLIYSFSSICHKPCLDSGCWAEWSSLTAVPILMVVVFLADLSHGWSLTEAQCLIKCVWRLFCIPWTSANSNFSQWLISRG